MFCLTSHSAISSASLSVWACVGTHAWGAICQRCRAMLFKNVFTQHATLVHLFSGYILGWDKEETSE